MIAIDSSTLVAFIEGDSGRDVEFFDRALASGNASLPPVVLTEVLSEPTLPASHRALVVSLPVLPIDPEYWIRAAQIRADILARKLRARLADALIAQACIDHGIPLVTRDADFRHFAKHCGLKLA